MRPRDAHRELCSALLLGLLTLALSLAAADGLIGLNQPPAGTRLGAVLFWAGLVGLPLVFWRRVRWRYTVVDLPLYFLLYFPIDLAFGPAHTHTVLSGHGFIAFPAALRAALTAAVFWGVQSLVYLAANAAARLLRRR